MKKIFKSILAVMIVFMQLSSPIEVFADIIDEEVGSNNNESFVVEDDNAIEDEKEVIIDNDVIKDNVYEEKIVEEGNIDETAKIVEEEKKVDVDENIELKTFNNDSTVSFDVNATVSNNKIQVNISNNNTENNYIAKLKVTFNQIQDGNIKDTKVLEKTLVLNNTVIELEDIGANLNGKYNLDVNIYKLEESLTGEDEDSLNAYIERNNNVIYNDTKEEFYENNIKTKLHLFIEGNNDIVCSNNNCNLDKNSSEKEVNINYQIDEADKTVDNNSYVKYTINNDIKLDRVNLNFSNLLYGTYEIKGVLYNSDEEEIAEDRLVITYGDFSDNEDITSYFVSDNYSDNDKIISMSLLDEKTKNELVDDLVSNVLSTNLNCPLDVDSDNDVVVSKSCYGKINDSDELAIVSEIIQKLNDAGIDARVFDKDGNQVNLNDNISTKMKLQINKFSIDREYVIVVKGDIDGGLVEDSDVNLVINSLFDDIKIDNIEKIAADVNNDSNVDILDISMFVGAVVDGYWVMANESMDNIIATFERENTDKIKVGDTFSINLVFNDFNYDYINAIEGILDYDKSVFELSSISGIDKLVEFNKVDTENNRFMNAGSYMAEGGKVVTLTFKALKASTDTIKLNDLIGAMDGVKLNITNNASIDITVEEDNISSSDNNDSNKKTNPVANFTDDKVVENNRASVNESSVVTKINNVIIYNNYLAKLEIEGYEIDFDKEILEYEITVDNDVDSLDISAVAEDSSSVVRIYGNSNFKEGENKVRIVVTASDGSERTYVINVNKKAADVVKKISTDDDKVANNNMEKTIIIILIILVVLGLLYLIFKKDDEEEKK